MARLGLYLRLAPVCALMGCAPEGGIAGPDTCGAEGYRNLIGTPVAAITLPRDLPYRIVGPEDAVTMDFLADRVNFHTDAEGVIVRVACG